MFYIDLKSKAKTRFDMSKFIPFEKDIYDITESYLAKQIKSLDFGGYFKVTGDGGRPDNISYKIYKHTQYWWILLLYNDLIFSEEVVEGQELEFPEISSLESLYFQLSTLKKVNK